MNILDIPVEPPSPDMNNKIPDLVAVDKKLQVRFLVTMSKNGSHLFTRNQQDFVIVLLRLKNNLSNRFPVVSFLKRERFVPQRSLFLLGQQPAQYSAIIVATLIQLWFPFRIPPALAFLGNYPFSNMKNHWWKGESIQIKMLLLK